MLNLLCGELVSCKHLSLGEGSVAVDIHPHEGWLYFLHRPHVPLPELGRPRGLNLQREQDHCVLWRNISNETLLKHFNKIFPKWTYLSKLRTQTRCRWWRMTRWRWVHRPGGCCWWCCWRCWRGQGIRWRGWSCGRGRSRAARGSWSRTRWRTSWRGSSRWWCSATSCAATSPRTQSRSSCLQ